MVWSGSFWDEQEIAMEISQTPNESQCDKEYHWTIFETNFQRTFKDISIAFCLFGASHKRNKWDSVPYNKLIPSITWVINFSSKSSFIFVLLSLCFCYLRHYLFTTNGFPQLLQFRLRYFEGRKVFIFSIGILRWFETERKAKRHLCADICIEWWFVSSLIETHRSSIWIRNCAFYYLPKPIQFHFNMEQRRNGRFYTKRYFIFL